jgi:hypothetical protein
LDDALHVHSAITATKKETKKGGQKEEGTWKEGRTNPREKAGGRKIEIRIVYCLHCCYISVAPFLLLLISRSLTSSCAAFQNFQNCTQRERETEKRRETEIGLQTNRQTDRTVNAGVRSNIS